MNLKNSIEWATPHKIGSALLMTGRKENISFCHPVVQCLFKKRTFVEFTELVIKNFSMLSKRKDIKHPQWFAISNDILLHPDFHDITGNEFKVFIWVFGVASKLNKNKVRIYHALCSRQINVTENEVHLTIEKLNRKRWDVTPTLRECNTDVTLQDKTRQIIGAVTQASRECHVDIKSNSTEIFDNRFKTPTNMADAIQAQELILETINQHPECKLKYLSPGIMRSLPKLMTMFETIERLQEWLTGILNSKKFNELTGDDWQRYVIGAILKELG